MIHTKTSEYVLYHLLTLPDLRFSHENIRCIMAYIVDLTVILNGLFMSSHSVSATEVQSAMKDYAQTGARGQIHAEIRSFVREMPFSTYQERDTIMEKIIDLIRQNCIPPSQPLQY